jgi:hypothetical protein
VSGEKFEGGASRDGASGEVSGEKFEGGASRDGASGEVSGDMAREASDSGSLTAEAEIVHRGRSTLVIEARVDDDRRRLIGKLVATQLTPVAPTVIAPAARPGR